MTNINRRENSFFQALKNYIAFGVRYVVFLGRKTPIVAYIAIAIYGIFCYQTFLGNKVAFRSQRNLPLPAQSSSNSTSTSTSSTSTSNSFPSNGSSPNPVVVNSQLSRQEKIEQELKEKELAKIAEEEKHLNQQRIEASKEKLKKGDVFVGELVYTKKGIAQEKQLVKLEVKAIVGKTYIVKFSDPNNERISQIFEGRLVGRLSSPKSSPLYVKESPHYASIYLKARSPQQLGGTAWKFYEYDTRLVLAPTELGFNGRVLSIKAAQLSHKNVHYKLVLRDENLD